MAASNFIERLTTGSRYQAEKVVTVVIYLTVSIATITWVFNSGNVDNELGATATFEKVGPLESPTFFIKNDSNDHWTNVRIAVDKKYLYLASEVKEGETLTLRPQDFAYYYYIPRPWGRESWESIVDEEKRGPNGQEEMSPDLLQIRADEGRYNINFATRRKIKR